MLKFPIATTKNSSHSAPAPVVSIIIVNYNARNYLAQTLTSLSKSCLKSFAVETIIVDNASTDNSFTAAKKLAPSLTAIQPKFLGLKQNLGFAKANNYGVSHSNPSSDFVFFLNPDTTIDPNTIAGMISYFYAHPKISAATANVILVRTGATQLDSHRGFPTPKNAFFHFFLPFLPGLFPHSKFFNGYYAGHLDYSKPTQIEACVGACLFVRRPVGEAIGWWPEDYFFYGEDLDFCYLLKKNNFPLWFLPQFTVYHYQGISSGIKQKNSIATKSSRITTARASTQAMRLFYQRHLINNYPKIIRPLIFTGINLLEAYRVFKAKYFYG